MIRLMNAAGWIKTPEAVQEMARSAVTDITIGSFTIEPREGNPGNNFWYDPASGTSLNSMGLPNQGLPYLEQHLPAYNGENCSRCRENTTCQHCRF